VSSGQLFHTNPLRTRQKIRRQLRNQHISQHDQQNSHTRHGRSRSNEWGRIRRPNKVYHEHKQPRMSCGHGRLFIDSGTSTEICATNTALQVSQANNKSGLWCRCGGPVDADWPDQLRWIHCGAGPDQLRWVHCGAVQAAGLWMHFHLCANPSCD